MLIRPWARGPGVSAMGGAGTGDGDRESAAGILAQYITRGGVGEGKPMCGGKANLSVLVFVVAVAVAVAVPVISLRSLFTIQPVDNALTAHVTWRFLFPT